MNGLQYLKEHSVCMCE